MNKVILMGRLGKSPELTYTQSGLALCKFTMATSETYVDKTTGQKNEKTEWHNITAWGKIGENLRQYVDKGHQLLIEGKIHYNKYQDKEGNNRISTEIVVERFHFVGNKATGNSVGGGAGSGAGAANKALNQPADDEDVPF